MTTQLSDESQALIERRYHELRTTAIWYLAAGSTAIEIAYPQHHDNMGRAIAELSDLLNRLRALTAGLPLPDEPL